MNRNTPNLVILKQLISSCFIEASLIDVVCIFKLCFHWSNIIFFMFSVEHNGDDAEYAMIVVDENNSTINDMDSPSLKVKITLVLSFTSLILMTW